jgi:hypothetical protein
MSVRAVPSRPGGDGRIVLGAGFADQRASLHEVVEVLLDGLVVDVELVFERVQLGILVDLPPFAAQHGVLRLRHLPARRVRGILRG